MLVKGKGTGKNKEGGVNISFKLVHVLDQEPIQKKVPKKEQHDQEDV